MLAEISVIPLDKGPEGLSDYLAESIKIIRESGLDHEVHALGTLVEGPADRVFDLIRSCHQNMVDKSNRVLMTIRIDDQKGLDGQIRAKAASVEQKA